MISGQVRIGWLMVVTAMISVPLSLAANLGQLNPFLVAWGLSSVALAGITFRLFLKSQLNLLHALVRLAWLTMLWSLILIFAAGCFFFGPISLLLR